MRGHRDLIAWQKAMMLVTDIYRASRAFPKDEVYGLTSQLRRSAVSVPSNLAEGHGRTSRADFHRFIAQARGSLLEVETQLEIRPKSRLPVRSGGRGSAFKSERSGAHH